MNAQLAHALGRAGRARRCYEVAGWLAAGGACGRGKVKEDRERDVYERDEWTRVAARAGEVWVRIGVLRMKMAEKRRAGDGGAVAAGDGDGDGDGDVGMRDAKEEDGHALRGDGEGEDEHELRELRMMGKEVVEECRGMGGSLSAVGEVISACLCDEIWGSKCVFLFPRPTSLIWLRKQDYISDKPLTSPHEAGTTTSVHSSWRFRHHIICTRPESTLSRSSAPVTRSRLG